MSKHDSQLTDLERHAGFLRSLASRSLCGEDVEDLVQDCLLIGLQHAPHDGKRTGGWFRTILRRRLAENQRSRMRREKREQVKANEHVEPSAFETVEHRAALRAVTDAVMDLPPELYDMVRLRYFDGMKIKEIAEHRGLSTRSVKYRLETALRQLRSKMEERPKGRAALVLLGGAAAGRAWDFGGWIAMKKFVFTVCVALIAIGSLTWVLWFNADDGGADLDEVSMPSESTEVQQPRRKALSVIEPGAGDNGRAEAPAIDRDRDIFGCVVDVNHEPIAGARIESRVYPWRRLSVLSPRSSESRVVETTTSSADGSFALRHERGDVVELSIVKRGFARLILTRRVAGEKVDIVLQPACKLRVVARTADGTPLAGAHVTAWRDQGKGRSSGQFDQRRGKTGNDGVLEFDDLAPGKVRLHARHLAHRGTEIQEVDLRLGEVNEVTCRFLDAGVIRGRVTDAATGKGIPAADVTVMWGSLAVKTDEQGYYERPGCPTGEKEWFNIDVEAKGYARASQTVRFGQPSYDFTLSPGDRVTGRCLDQSGAPIAGVRISMIGSTFDARGQQVDTGSAISGADGRFQIEDLDRTMAHTLVLQAAGFGRRHVDFDPHRGEEAGVIELGNIVLVDGVRIAGAVRTEKAEPIVGASVTLIGTNADRAERRGPGFGPAQISYGESEKRRTDDLGRFCFSHLMPGDYELKVQIDGSVPISNKVTVTEAGLDNIEIVVDSPRPLRVRVVDENQNPVAKVSVSLWSGEKEILSQLTDVKGDASFIGAPREVLTLRFSTGLADGFRPAPAVQIDAGVAVKEVVLFRKTPVTGRVLGPDGKGLSQVQVSARWEDDQKRSVFTKRGGHFSLDLPAGKTVTLEVTGIQMKRVAEGMYTHESGPMRGRLEGVVVPSQGVVIRAEVVKATKELAIVVKDPHGNRIEGARVFASPHTGFDARLSDSSGRVLLQGLFGDPLRVQAHPPVSMDGKLYSSEPTTVTPANQEVTVTLRKAMTVGGKVILPGGEPAVRFIVEARVGGQEHYRNFTDADGQFELTLVDGLSYEIKSYSRDRTLRGNVGGVKKGPVTIKVSKENPDKD